MKPYFVVLLIACNMFAQVSLHEAVKTDNYTATESFLQKGCFIDSLDASGFAPLHYAATSANSKMMRFLIEHRSNPDVRDSRGKTPLHYIAETGPLTVFKELIALGADWEAVYNKPFLDDKTIPKYPINLAGEAGNGEIVDYLKSDEFPVSGKVVINLVKKDDWDRFYKAANNEFPLDERDYLGATPLMYAVKTTYAERWMKYLMDKGANPMVTDYYQRNLYHYAAIYGAYSVVELIADHKVDIEARDTWGNTPLCTAAWNSGLNTFENLLDAGAITNVKNNDGDTPLIIVLRKKKDETAVDIMKLLLKKNADVNAKAKDELTPLCIAVMKNKPESVKFLLDNNANVNNIDSEGWTPVLQAVFMNNGEQAASMLSLLLDKKPTNLESKYQGKTAMEIAKSKGYDACVTLLADAGAKE